MATATLERLRTLRAQVGGDPAPATVRVAAPEPASRAIPPPSPDDAPRPLAGAAPVRHDVPAHIRRLLGLRERAPAPRWLGSEAPEAPAATARPDAARTPFAPASPGSAAPPGPSTSPARHALPGRAPDRHLPGDEIAPGLRYLESRHAPPSLPPVLDASFARDFASVERDRLLCFDTETTGLAGGTGTRAFMIGAADVVDGQLRVRQLLTTTMAAEEAMLAAFARWLAPGTVLASYNGRSYDAPLLKARYRLARQPCPITPLAHLDLLHPARRRWRGRWENCRLGTIERRVLGVLREDDLPGSEAPRAWRDWLAGGDAGDLRRVLAHNHTDVRSLWSLLAVLALGDDDGA